MKVRNLILPLFVLGLLVSAFVAFAAMNSSVPNSKPTIQPSSSAVASPSLAPLASGSASKKAHPPASGPSPVNFLTVGTYLTNYHWSHQYLADPVVGDFNGDGYSDIVALDGYTCLEFMPGGKSGALGKPVDTCILPNTGADTGVAGDFNNDGKLDIAMVASTGCNGAACSANVMFAQGNGDGTFSNASNINLSNLGYFEGFNNVAAADVNNDGNLDLLLVTTGGHVYVLLGDGKLGFTVSSFVVEGSANQYSAIGLGITDFNKDGKLDLAVSSSAGNVAVMLGNGDGTFEPAVTYAMDIAGIGQLALGDVNGDGLTDIVVTTFNGQGISVFLGNGDGTFQKVIDSSSTVLNPNYIALADVNGDGKADAIVSTNAGDYGGDTIDVLLSNGDGTFQPAVQYAVVAGPGRVRVGDFNNDGHPDWVTLTPGSILLSVGINTGTGGQFIGAKNFQTTPGNDTTSGDIVAADFNNDGKLDYATVTNFRYNTGVNVCFGDGAGNFSAPVYYSVGNGQPNNITSGDFNNDGYPDIAVLDLNNGTVSVLLNKGDGTFDSPVAYTAGKGGGLIQTRDFNNDGKLDIVTTNSGDGTVSVLLGNGDGTFQTQKVSTSEASAGNLAVGDFDGDGNLDVAAADYGSGNIAILIGNGDGTFKSPTTLKGPADNAGMVAADFNKDGKIDLVAVSQNIPNGTGGNGGVQVLLGNGDGTFKTGVNYPTVPVPYAGNSSPGNPVVGDLNNDGNVDIMMVSQPLASDSNGQGHLVGPPILLGNGDGTFTLNPGTPAVTGITPGKIALGIFNNSSTALGAAVLDVYGGNDNNTLDTVTMLLSVSGTEVVLTSSANPSTQGESVTFTGTVVTSIPGLPTPTGTITFTYGSTSVPVTMTNGAASYSTTTLPLGNTTVVASYSGDSNFNPATSLGLLQVVNPAPLTITTTTLPDAVQNVSYSGTVVATGGLGPYSFSISAGALPTGLSINSSNGSISGTPTGVPGTADFTVQVKDSESPQQIATANLSITVDSNLQITTTSLPNGVAGDSYSQTLTATGGLPPYTFTVSSGNLPAGLTLSASGAITGTPNTAGTSSFTVQVQDSAVPPQSTTVNLSITITPALSITTTSLPGGVQGTPYSSSVAATGGIAPYSFTISNGSLPTGLTMSSGGLISGTPTNTGTFNFTVQATDSSTPPQAVTANLSITVASSLKITTTSLPNGVAGDSYSQTITASGGIPSYTFSIISGALPAGLSLATSGAITGTPATAGTSAFTVQVKDSNTPPGTATANLSITITPALSITTTSLPGGTEGTAYNASVVASGGVSPYNISVTTGLLPAGLTMSTSGAITGTPTNAGTASFTVQATDSSTPPQVVTANLSITIASNLKITTTSLPNGVAGTPYSASVMASGGTTPYTFTTISGNLPAGLSLATSGAITGTPTTAGTSSFTVQVKDTNSPPQTVTANLSITIGAGLTITTASLPGGVVGDSYSATVLASGGTTPYTFTTIGGSLPTGLSLSTAGAITGTPTTAGTFSFTVQVKDASTPPETATANLSITIAPSLTITTTSLPAGVLNNSYSAAVTASGGVTPYTFSISKGALPGGLKLSGSGTISGSPSGLGTYTFTVQVKDANTPRDIATAQLSITVSNNLKITTTSLPNAEVGTMYSATIQASGGTAPYTFSLPQGGGLPQGLSLSSTGVISGRVFPPTQTFSFEVQVQDSSNPVGTVTATLSITVYDTLTITTTSLPDGVAGAHYSSKLTAKGGTPPYTFGIASGTLPAGLTISSGGTISGTPSGANGTSTFTVQVLDSSFPQQEFEETLSITITGRFRVVSTTLPEAIDGIPYRYQIVSSGGTAPYTYSMQSGSIWAGLSLSTSGVISGTTPQNMGGASGFTIMVTDSSTPPLTSTMNLTLIVVEPLKILTTSLPPATVGVPYSQTIATSGGTPLFFYGISSGSLPAGLTLNENVISGTPTTAGTSSFTFEVVDSGNPQQTAQQPLSITVN